jgi:hypothetical protein
MASGQARLIYLLSMGPLYMYIAYCNSPWQRSTIGAVYLTYSYQFWYTTLNTTPTSNILVYYSNYYSNAIELVDAWLVAKQD